MTRMLDLDRDLTAWLESAGPADASPAAVEHAFQTARRVRQRRGLAFVFAGPRPWPAYGSPRRRLAAAGAGVLAVTLLAIGLALTPNSTGPGATPRPTETLAPSGAPRSIPFALPSVGPAPTGAAIPIDQGNGIGGEPDTTTITPAHQLLSGSTFGLPVTLWLEYFGGDASKSPQSDWCAATTSPRSIVLPYLMGCVADARILRPSAVRCGTATDQPGVDELAQAILRNPLLAAEDLGPVAGSEWLPPRLFADPAPAGRVILIGGKALGPITAGVDLTKPDPYGCLIVADSPNVEVRGDLGVLLVLLEVRGELVIIDVSGGGHDGPSMSAARQRGYHASGTSYFWALLGTIHDISFGQ